MSQLVLRVLGMVGVLFAVAAPPANAQEPPVRVRGTIERVDGKVSKSFDMSKTAMSRRNLGTSSLVAHHAERWVLLAR